RCSRLDDARQRFAFPSPAQRERVASAEREPGEGLCRETPPLSRLASLGTLSPLRGARGRCGMSAARTTHLTAAGLIGPATLYVGVGILLPLAILFRYGLNQFVPGKFMVDALTVENYVKFFTDIYYYSVLTRTVRIALITTLICLVLGFPLAYVLARTRMRYKNLRIMLVVLPLFVGNAVRAAGWMVAFGSKCV